MSKIFVGKVNEFENSSNRKLVTVDHVEIGVFRHKQRFYAFKNLCPHAGGPVCEGKIMGNTEASFSEDRTEITEWFSEEKNNIACPWHGMEFDLATGRSTGDKHLILTAYEVIVESDDVYLKL